MRKLLLAVVLCLVLPASAEAHAVRRLSLSRGRLAVQRFERHIRGSIGACHVRDATRIVCLVTEPAEEQEGEPGTTTVTYQLQARLVVKRQTIRLELADWGTGGPIGGERV